MLTDEERRLRKRKRRRWIVVVLVLLLLIPAGFFGAGPARNEIKAWQARRHAQRALASIDKERWEDARNEAVAAYRLRQTEPEAVRAVARFLSRTRQPDALEFWTQLGKIDKLTRDDLRDEASIAMMANEGARAIAAVNELLADKDAGPPDWLLAAQLSINKGAPAEAQIFLDRIFMDSRATAREQLQASVLELASARSGSSASAERESAAWSRLEKLSANGTDVRLDALVLLAQRALSNQKSEVSGQRTQAEQPSVEVGDQRAEGRGQRAKGRGHRSEGRDQRSEVTGQKSEVSGQKAEGSDQRSEVS